MLKAYKIKYISPTSPIRSFTIFGAICWSYKLLYGADKLNQFLEEFSKNPKFLISSAFPYIKGQFLFPKPILPIKGIEQDFKLKIQRKDFKKAKYITLGILKQVLKGEIKNEEDFSSYQVKSGVIKENDIDLDIIQLRHTQVRNNINRISHTSENLFFIESDFKLYDEYFLVYFFDDKFEEEFKKLIKLTEQIGFGGNKNIGWGKIKIEEIDATPLNDFVKSNTEKLITLSPIIPTQNLNPEQSYYDIETLKTYTENTFEEAILKKKVLYLKEGSLLDRSKENEFVGTLKNMGNNILQYGLEFPLGVG